MEHIKTSKPMTELDIQRGIMVERYARSFVLPNYTPHGHWECDVFQVTEAGYFYEYEIKISRGDFFADAKKQRTRWQAIRNPESPKDLLGNATGSKWEQVTTTKHQCIGKPEGPRCFYYATPAGLIKESEVPAWAGLIDVVPGGKFVRCNVVKKAPKLHDEKLNPEVVAHARGVAYWRFQRMFLHRSINFVDDKP